jgi:hypothetical protein
VQIVYSSHRGSRDIEHIGSAHDEAGLELLKAAARQRLAAGQGELDLGLDTGGLRSRISAQIRLIRGENLQVSEPPAFRVADRVKSRGRRCLQAPLVSRAVGKYLPTWKASGTF